MSATVQINGEHIAAQHHDAIAEAQDTISEARQDIALILVAGWIGRQLGRTTVETGTEAYSHARGPMLKREWDWPAVPVPTILMEGVLEDWAIYATADTELVALLRAFGVYAEPYSSYALCLYPLPDHWVTA